MWKATSFEAFVQKILQVRLHSDIDPMTDDCKVVFLFYFFAFLCMTFVIHTCLVCSTFSSFFYHSQPDKITLIIQGRNAVLTKRCNQTKRLTRKLFKGALYHTISYHTTH